MKKFCILSVLAAFVLTCSVDAASFNTVGGSTQLSTLKVKAHKKHHKKKHHKKKGKKSKLTVNK